MVKRKPYPSDLSREQFELIRPLLENAKKKTRPRTVDLFDVFCAILYLLKSGCPWRMIPRDFPKWRTVHEYFRHWSEAPTEGDLSLLERALKKAGYRGPHAVGSQREDHVLHR